MSEHNSFFSDKHTRLLNFAWTAKILNQFAIIIYVIYIGSLLYQWGNSITNGGNIMSSIQSYILNMPFDAVRQLVNILIPLIQGLVVFVILKAVSLGLNMIVETDINYREKQDGRNE